MSETSRFGDLHTKTYDIELLISGALVFGLLTVPGTMDRLFDRWGGRLDGLASPALTYFYLYGQIIVYGLLATFIAHLCLRGYWIALLGIESVWGDGWNWDRLGLGPFTRERMQRRVTTLSAAINKADDRASVIFAAGALLVMITLYSLLVVILAVAAGVLLQRATGIPGPTAFFTVLAVTFVPMALIPWLDKKIGRQLDPNTAAGRFFGRLVDVGMFLSPLRWTAQVQFVFQTRIGERRLSMVLAATLGVIATTLVLGMAFRAGRLRVDGWQFFDPGLAAVSIDPARYRDSGVERNGRRPTIDSDVISGPLIRLYLPYLPRRHNPMIAKACPDLAAAVARGDAPDNTAAAACLGGLYTVALNGEAVTSTYRFTRDTDSDFVGVLAYLPTAGLQAGPHELTIDMPLGDDNRELIRIPFYTVGR